MTEGKQDFATDVINDYKERLKTALRTTNIVILPGSTIGHLDNLIDEVE